MRERRSGRRILSQVVMLRIPQDAISATVSMASSIAAQSGAGVCWAVQIDQFTASSFFSAGAGGFRPPSAATGRIYRDVSSSDRRLGFGGAAELVDRARACVRRIEISELEGSMDRAWRWPHFGLGYHRAAGRGRAGAP